MGVVLALALPAVFMACGPDTATPTEAPAAFGEATVDRTGWPAKVRLGLIPTEANVIADWTPVVEHLEARLELEVEVFVGADYTATITAARNGDVDIVQLGPTSYVKAREQGADIEPVVRWINEDSGIAGYNSLLITHKNSGITTIENARGRTFAFNDPESTSGFLVPTVFFLERNIDPESYFSDVSFAGSHEATALAVVNGTVDLASNNNETLPRLFETGKLNEDDLRIIWTSALIPTDPISVQNSLPASFHTAVKEAFLSFDDPAALGVLRIQGWIPTEDGDYDVVRTLEATRAQLASVN
ncbi:MAG: phosphate/phosphite/phosphonate ABC transporter substrate-binding protein [Chloroflexi bacterium]|nr:phosphate/phosphite/phosphonate ABC transporter substrate-binding protein [Chloroflexota bacterium]